ncbi:acyl-CoA dehydrogenase family protein [Bosea sp. R86505]|uniref:acyl-CoA dehydrogenase family protein n=1 Tax=Bosea sp. R86505 TaxID=3101710 RepID=UPI00366FF858
MTGEDAAPFLARVRDFARDTVTVRAPLWAKGQAIEPEVVARAAEIGLTGIEVPTQLGGLGLSFRAKVEACAIVAAADFGFAMSLVNTHNVAKRIATTMPETVARRYLPDLLSGTAMACTALTEEGAGSDVAALSCTARPVGDGWLLDGEKTWIVNGRHAALAIVYAQCGEPGQSAGIGAFLVDLTDTSCHRFPIETEISQASIGTGGFRLTGCFVPSERMVLPAGTAFKAILSEINGARIYVAAMCCAMVSSALRVAQAYGETRQTFGQKLTQHPAWREGIAQIATVLAASWSLVEAALLASEQGRDVRHLAAAAKVNAVDLAQTVLPRLLHAMGAEGLRGSYPFTRHLGAAQLAALTDGSTAMLLDRLGRWDPTPISL